MSLYTVTCSCGWSAYRNAPGAGDKKCPQCRNSGLQTAPVEHGSEVRTPETDGSHSLWHWEERRWVKQ